MHSHGGPWERGLGEPGRRALRLRTPLPLLADRMTLSRIDVGDLIAVRQSGAYGCSASPLGFLGRLPPGKIPV